MKKLLICLFCALSFTFKTSAQVNDSELTGKWKFVKMEMKGSIGFNLDSLTTSYKKFFEKQKQDVYHGMITTNDSLYIQVLFSKLVNDVSRMFISFRGNKYYETNNYDKAGNMTEKNERGTYVFNKAKNIIYTYPNGNRKRPGSFKILYLDNSKLVIVFDHSSKPAVFTCKRVSE